MYEFRATAVRYRKKNTTLKYSPRLKRYRTRLQTTVILTVASQHGLSLPVFVVSPSYCGFTIYNIFPPFLRPCVIHPRRKYFNQPVPSNLIFLFFYHPHSAETKIPCSFFNILCIIWFYSLFLNRFGYVNSWGVSHVSPTPTREELIAEIQIFQDYYHSTLLRDSSPSSM